MDIKKIIAKKEAEVISGSPNIYCYWDEDGELEVFGPYSRETQNDYTLEDIQGIYLILEE